MGDKKFTFIELHLDGNTQFGPKRIGDVVSGEDDLEEPVAVDDDTDDTDEAVVAAEDDGNGGKAVGFVLTLAVLAGIALAVKKLRGDDEGEELPPEEEPDIIVN